MKRNAFPRRDIYMVSQQPFKCLFTENLSTENDDDNNTVGLILEIKPDQEETPSSQAIEHK